MNRYKGTEQNMNGFIGRYNERFHRGNTAQTPAAPFAASPVFASPSALWNATEWPGEMQNSSGNNNFFAALGNPCGGNTNFGSCESLAANPCNGPGNTCNSGSFPCGCDCCGFGCGCNGCASCDAGCNAACGCGCGCNSNCETGLSDFLAAPAVLSQEVCPGQAVAFGEPSGSGGCNIQHCPGSGEFRLAAGHTYQVQCALSGASCCNVKLKLLCNGNEIACLESSGGCPMQNVSGFAYVTVPGCMDAELCLVNASSCPVCCPSGGISILQIS